MPLDEQGQVSFRVCPDASNLVHLMLTPDARSYRVAPVREFEILANTSVTLTLTRHEAALEYLKPDE